MNTHKHKYADRVFYYKLKQLPEDKKFSEYEH